MRKVTPIKARLGHLFAGAAISVLSVGAVAAEAAHNDSAQIDEIFAEWDNTRSPGCVAFAFKDGEIILNRAYGMADLEWPIPLTTDTVFYMASVSKQFTAAAVALLALDGKLNLEDDVTKYIPELSGVGATIKVKHLVHHTSGLRDYFTLLNIKGETYYDAMTNQDVLDLMEKQRGLDFEPGTKFSYSNSGYVMMAVLVERVSGKTLGAFMKERVFEPLGMKNTSFDEDHRAVVPKRARSFVKNDAGKWLRRPKIINSAGGGNLLSTAADMQLWDENFYTGKVGGQAFIDLMLSSRMSGVIIHPQNPKVQYAFGLAVGLKYRGQSIVEHGGAFMGFRTQMIRFPDQHFSAGVLCNAGNARSSDLSYKIADAYLVDVLEPIEQKKAKAEPEAPKQSDYVVSTPESHYVGTYSSGELDVDIGVAFAGDAFAINSKGLENAKLVPVAEHVFIVERDGEQTGVKVTFHFEGGEQSDYLTLDLGRAKNIRFDRR